MQNIVFNMCEKLLYDRLRNDRSSGNWKSDCNKKLKKNNNNKQNNVGGQCHWVQKQTNM